MHTLEGHRNVVYAIGFNNPYGLVGLYVCTAYNSMHCFLYTEIKLLLVPLTKHARFVVCLPVCISVVCLIVCVSVHIALFGVISPLVVE